LALCSALVGPAGQAQQGLTLDHALGVAQDRSRQLAAQDAAAAAARELAVAAGQLPDPTLKVGINNFRHPDLGGSLFGISHERVDHFGAGLGMAEGLLS
jgi:hypothetical protein